MTETPQIQETRVWRKNYTSMVTPQVYYSKVVSDVINAFEILEETEKLITDGGFLIKQSGIHHLPNNQYLPWHIYTRS